MWAAQGITEPTRGLRTAPSANATYPLRVYLVAGNVQGLQAGVYRYLPQGHKLELVVAGDQRANIGDQPQMHSPPVLLAFTADYTTTSKKYGAQAPKMAYIELGHAAENVLLEEVALGLVGVPMGGINVEKMTAALKLPKSEVPLYLVAAGYKR